MGVAPIDPEEISGPRLARSGLTGDAVPNHGRMAGEAPVAADDITYDRCGDCNTGEDQERNHAEKGKADDDEQRQRDDGSEQDCGEGGQPDAASMQVWCGAAAEHATNPPGG